MNKNIEQRLNEMQEEAWESGEYFSWSDMEEYLIEYEECTSISLRANQLLAEINSLIDSKDEAIRYEKNL